MPGKRAAGYNLIAGFCIQQIPGHEIGFGKHTGINIHSCHLPDRTPLQMHHLQGSINTEYMRGFGLYPVVDDGYKAVTFILKMAAGSNILSADFLSSTASSKKIISRQAHVDIFSEGIDD